MTLDALAIRRLRDELRRDLPGARIDKALHPAENVLALDLYGHSGRRQLVLAVAPQSPAAFLAEERLGRQDDRTSPFLLLARKYLRGGRVRAVDQLDFDRVLTLDVEQVEDGERRRCRLVAELTGRLANLVLLNEGGFVLDAMRRVPGTINRVRTLMPGDPYLPPPISKPGIFDLGDPDLRRLDQSEQGKLAGRVAVGAAHGVSPLLAREAVQRAGGGPEAVVGEISLVAIFARVREIVEAVTLLAEGPTGAWSGDRLVAFAPYELTHLPGARPAGSISALIQASFEQGGAPAGIASRRQQVLDRIDGLLGRERRIGEELASAIERARDAERFRIEGELLLAYQSAIRPGQQTLLVDGREISLDPTESPVEQSQSRFRQYKKLKAMAAGLPERLAAVGDRIEWLETTWVHALAARGAEDLQLIERELAGLKRGPASGPGRSKRPAGKSGKAGGAPRQALGRQEIDGWEVVYGRTASQNEQVTFSVASPDDLWLHARGVPGAHVVVRAQRQAVPEPVVRRAAALAAGLSAARAATRVDVDVTEVRHVKKRPGGTPGAVTYRGERTIAVAPDAAD